MQRLYTGTASLGVLLLMTAGAWTAFEPLFGMAGAAIGYLVALSSLLWLRRRTAKSESVTTMGIAAGLGAIVWFSLLVGHQLMKSELRRAIPRLEVEARHVISTSRLITLSDSSLVRIAVPVQTGMDRIGVVRFGLTNGKVLEFVPDKGLWPDQRKARCVEEIEPGWFLHSRCGN